MVSHAGGAVYGYQLIEPQVAVALFFVVSGFYMSFIITEKYSVLPNGTSRFYLNWFLRLYPTYLAVLVAVVLFQTVTRKNNVFYNPAPDVDGFHRLIYSLLNFFDCRPGLRLVVFVLPLSP